MKAYHKTVPQLSVYVVLLDRNGCRLSESLREYADRKVVDGRSERGTFKNVERSQMSRNEYPLVDVFFSIGVAEGSFVDSVRFNSYCMLAGVKECNNIDSESRPLAKYLN